MVTSVFVESVGVISKLRKDVASCTGTRDVTDIYMMYYMNIYMYITTTSTGSLPGMSPLPPLAMGNTVEHMVSHTASIYVAFNPFTSQRSW